MKRLLTLLVAAAVVLMAAPAFATIAGSPHDFAGFFGRCGTCHVPHAAVGTNRLWRVAVPGAGTPWHASTVGSLCATCHASDASIGSGNVNTDVPHKNDNIFATTSHGRTVATLAVVGGSNATRPYMGKVSMECTSCHNVHFDGAFASASPKRPFLRPAATQTTMSEFCADCHNDRYNNAHLANANVELQHPVRIDYQSATATLVAIASMPAGLKTAVALNTWSLGGKFEGNLTAAPAVTDLIGCGTCHAVHNPAGTNANDDQANHLLAINNVAANAALCVGCHGNPTGNTARPRSGAQMLVGAATGDHPIDCAITTADGGPAIDRWFTNGSTIRAERHQVASNVWPRGTGGNIICTSCHSAHKTMAAVAGIGQKLRRTGGSVQGWCLSCHKDASPSGHHSHSGNWATSGLTCESCHGTGLVGAHNGFSFNSNFATVVNNDKSQLCNWCHLGVAAPYTATDDDPFVSAVPNGHLGAPVGGAGSSSHYLGSFTKSEPNSIDVKEGNWGDATHLMYSKYGGSETHGLSSDATGTEIVCESCHSVTRNIGASGLSIVPGAATGYNNNLLLQDYRDDSSAGSTVQAEFCVACHNQGSDAQGMGSANGAVSAWTIVGVQATVPDGTHPMTGWVVTRAVDESRTPTTLITGASSYANANGGVPNGINNYYGVNAMDCDTCHRPHNAPVNSKYDRTVAGGAGNARPVILEKQAAANEWADLCQSCHPM